MPRRRTRTKNAQEKHETEQAPQEPDVSESPIVSDDDGVDAAGRALSNQNGGFPSMADVEHLPDVSSSEDEAPPPRAFDDGGSDSDSSMEGALNPVGDIPMRWYEGYDHIGYTRDGEKLVAKNKPNALELAADPHAWRRVYDDKNDEELTLTHSELKAIARLRAGRNPHGVGEGMGETVWWSGPVRDAPLPSGTEPKRRFLPSRHEARLVVRYVRAMREGRMRRPSERRKHSDEASASMRYDLWEGHEPKTREEMSKSERARDIMRVPAPKVSLPTHDESYNPPAEYLPSKEERDEWENTDPDDRATNYLPQKMDALRHVPLYDNFIKERFERCLDLYLAVRIKKDAQRLTADDLLPKLPNPRDLRPFPTAKVLEFGPLPSRARSIDVHSAGQWLLSGSDDGVVRLWEVATGFMRAQWDLGKLVPKVDDRIQPIMNVAWRQADDSYVFAACVGKSLFIVAAAPALGVADIDGEALILGSKAIEKDNEEAAGVNKSKMEDGKDEEVADNEEVGKDDKNAVEMKDVEENDSLNDPKQISWHDRTVEAVSAGRDDCKCQAVEVTHARSLRSSTWHRKGDYIGTVGKDSSGGTVAMHRLTQRSSRTLFRKRSGGVQCIRFHPTRPFLLVATMHHVRIYNLAADSPVKVLKPGVRWISDMDVHSSGDHVLITSYDKRVCWFDLDLSVRPYKIIRNHDKAVRSARFHPRLPLFADAADDGSLHVFHATVYDDLAKNALIVPVRRLINAHSVVESLGVLALAWHPRLPWLFSAGADCRLSLFADTT